MNVLLLGESVSRIRQSVSPDGCSQPWEAAKLLWTLWRRVGRLPSLLPRSMCGWGSTEIERGVASLVLSDTVFLPQDPHYFSGKQV